VVSVAVCEAHLAFPVDTRAPDQERAVVGSADRPRRLLSGPAKAVTRREVDLNRLAADAKDADEVDGTATVQRLRAPTPGRRSARAGRTALVGPKMWQMQRPPERIGLMPRRGGRGRHRRSERRPESNDEKE